MSFFHPDDLANDILEQRCALLIGPEVLTTHGQPVTGALQHYLQTNYGRHVQHIFEREGLFKFYEEKSKKRVQTEALQSFFKQVQPDEDVLKQILEIPFHLVLQITPDTFLSDLAHKYSIGHQFRYFSGGGKSAEEVDMPGTATPLFYNLCGMRDRYDSMVLDYDDLFSFLKTAFGVTGLPKNLREALSQCTTFLFLGFQLDKWYTQMLMRWVGDNVKGAERFANEYLFRENEKDIEEFVRQHLQIVTVEKQHLELLHDLHSQLSQSGKLRQLTNPVSPNTVSIRRLVQHGDLEKALEVFRDVADSVSEKDAAILLLGEYRELVKAKEEYQFTNDQFWERCQKLKFRLLKYLNEHAYQL